MGDRDRHAEHVDSHAGHTHGAPLTLRDIVFVVLVLMAIVVPVIASGLLRFWQASKQGCHSTGEETCCRAEKSGEAMRVYLDEPERGHYLVRLKAVAAGLEYCYRRDQTR